MLLTAGICRAVARSTLEFFDYSLDLLVYIRSLFGDVVKEIDNLIRLPLFSFTTDANDVVVRLEPFVGLAKLLPAD